MWLQHVGAQNPQHKVQRMQGLFASSTSHGFMLGCMQPSFDPWHFSVLKNALATLCEPWQLLSWGCITMGGMPAFKRDFKVWVAPIRSRPAAIDLTNQATESCIDTPEHWQVFRRFDVDQDNHLDKASLRENTNMHESLRGFLTIVACWKLCFLWEAGNVGVCCPNDSYLEVWGIFQRVAVRAEGT